MKFPIAMNQDNTLVVVREDFFDLVGNLDLEQGLLDLNVSFRGLGCLKWILDTDGTFYPLTFRELLPATVLQKLRLRRRVERYVIEPGMSISVGELNKYLASMREAFEEAPNVADLREQIATYPDDHIVNAGDMRIYMNLG